jgi:hypothetical protein
LNIAASTDELNRSLDEADSPVFKRQDVTVRRTPA